MKLLIKQRVFSWTDTYDVFDENEQPRYYVKSEFFSIGHQIHVYECNSDREVGAVHQKLFSLLPTFEIVINGNTIGRIKKDFTFFKPKYQIDCNGWQVDGNYIGWNYQVTNQDQVILTITKEPFHWGDTYVIDYLNREDELLGLLLVIAIDAVNCSASKN